MPGRWSRTVDERRARGRLHVAALDVRVLDGVHVDRLAVRVRRPVRRSGRDRVAAVERRGVVGRHRRGIAAAVRVDRLHAPDREPLRVQATEHREHRSRRRPRSRSSCPCAADRRSPSTTCAARAAAPARPGSPRDTTTAGRPRSPSTTVPANAGTWRRRPSSGSRSDRGRRRGVDRVDANVVVVGARRSWSARWSSSTSWRRAGASVGPDDPHAARASTRRPGVQRTAADLVARFVG